MWYEHVFKKHARRKFRLAFHLTNEERKMKARSMLVFVPRDAPVGWFPTVQNQSQSSEETWPLLLIVSATAVVESDLSDGQAH